MKRRLGTCAGLTLIEVVFSSAILMVALGGLYSIVLSTQNSFREGLSTAGLEGRAHRVITRLARELQSARAEGGLNPTLDDPAVESSFLEFRQNEGYGPDPVTGNDTILWSDPIQISFEYTPTEIDNGLDDDGNGLVDDGQIVWTVDPGQPNEHRMTLARGVRELLEGETADGTDENGNGFTDEPGLMFTRDGDALTIRLSMERADADGDVDVVTLETTVYLKN